MLLEQINIVETKHFSTTLVEPLVRVLTVYFCHHSFKFGADVHSLMRVSGEDWVLANINVSGYFRVNYDLDNWDRLLSLLNTDHRVSHMHLLKVKPIK